MTQGERIRELRKELGLTLEKFGEKIGVTKSTISNIESGNRNATEHMVKSICREFNVSEEWLRTGQGEMFIKLDKEDELMQWAGSVLGDESSSFKKNFIKILMSLTEDEWELLERKAKELAELKKDT